MSKHHLEPAKSIIAKIGITQVVEITGAHPSRVYRWMYPQDKGGTGGVIPHWHVKPLIEFARANKIKLRDADFAPITKGRAA